MSLDGFIAGPQGEVDWIVEDPEMDFGPLFAAFDTLVMGRGTYETAMKLGGGFMGMKAYVCSTTLGPDDCPGATVTSDGVATVVALKDEPGKDIWLFGGGILFRSLFEAGLVDGLDVALMPVVLGQGLSLAPPLARRAELRLKDQRSYPSGIIFLRYDIVSPGAG